MTKLNAAIELEILYPIIQDAQNHHVAFYLLASHSYNCASVGNGNTKEVAVAQVSAAAAAAPVATSAPAARPRYVL